MSRMIDADDLLTAFPIGDEPTVTIACIRATIKHMPTIEERKTGEWTVKEGELAFWDVCSVCRKKIIHRTPQYNFCPNCGADMRGV